MKLLKVLGTKPWLHDTEAGGVAAYAGPDNEAAARIALRFVLAIVGLHAHPVLMIVAGGLLGFLLFRREVPE